MFSPWNNQINASFGKSVIRKFLILENPLFQNGSAECCNNILPESFVNWCPPSVKCSNCFGSFGKTVNHPNECRMKLQNFTVNSHGYWWLCERILKGRILSFWDSDLYYIFFKKKQNFSLIQWKWKETKAQNTKIWTLVTKKYKSHERRIPKQR